MPPKHSTRSMLNCLGSKLPWRRQTQTAEQTAAPGATSSAVDPTVSTPLTTTTTTTTTTTPIATTAATRSSITTNPLAKDDSTAPKAANDDSVNLRGSRLPPFLVQTKDLTSPDVDFSKLYLDKKLPFTKRELFSLIKSWKAIHRDENITKTGVEMFVKLFKTNSELQTLFQGFKHIRSDDELRSNEALEYHATLVMTTLDDAITHIDNYEFVRQLLHKTGASHIKFPGFVPNNFMQIKEPFLEAVRVTLGDRYTDNMQNIYTIAITFILQTLIEGITEALEASRGRNGNPVDAPGTTSVS